jgi:hypothetical protein
MTELDQHLDNILKASGSGLKNYSMQKTLNDMLSALKAAIAAEREACAKIVEDSPSYDWHKFACEAAYAIRARGEQA